MKELELYINNPQSPKLIELKGNIVIKSSDNFGISLGKTSSKSVLKITRPNIVVDGNHASIIFLVDNLLNMDFSLIKIMPEATSVTIKNLNIKVIVSSDKNSSRSISAIYNLARATNIENVKINMKSNSQINLFGIRNYSDKSNLHSTKGDDVTIHNCTINLIGNAKDFSNECTAYGIYNEKSDSISVENNFIKVVMDGDGEKQKAIGVYNSGKFARFVGNNIKASALHPEGLLREKAHAIGFVNEGRYTLISANNIVGERGGACIGLYNKADFANICGNKILSTHTINAVTIKNQAFSTVINSNIITTTGKNVKIIEQNAKFCVITNNFLRVLLKEENSLTACGIYAVGERCRYNNISNNMIRDTKTCGVYVDEKCGIVENNIVFGYEDTIKTVTYQSNIDLYDIFDEKNIRSLTN